MLPAPSLKSATPIELPREFFFALGNLHDAEITALKWEPAQKRVSILLEDLYSNFLGLPEYPGKTAACFIAFGAGLFEVDVSPDQFPLRIQDWEIDPDYEGSGLRVLVSFGPNGHMRFDCSGIGCYSEESEM